MNSIPMTVAGLKEQYEYYKREETHLAAQLKECRRRNRKAYLKWQKAIEEGAR